MKILVSTLLLLFLSGTSGAAIEPVQQQEVEQSPKATLRQSVKSLLYHSIAFGADLASCWESSEADREETLNKRSKLIWKSYFNIGYSAADELGAIYKEVSGEIAENYPVYYNNVIPVYVSYMVQAIGNVRSAVAEILPYVEKFEERLKPLQDEFWEEIRPILQNNTRSTIEELNTAIKPYIESVRKEVAAAKTKDESKPPSEKEPEIPLLDENIKYIQRLQRLLTYDDDQVKKMISDLKIFNTKA